MSQFLQVLLSGLSTGAIDALAAIGFTPIWQAAQTVNFAQGEFVMLPAFFVLIGVHWLHMPLWLALVFGLMVVVGGARPLLRAGPRRGGGDRASGGSAAEGYYLMIYAVAVIVLMVFCPTGLIGVGERLSDRLRPKREARADMKLGAHLRVLLCFRCATFPRRTERSALWTG